MNINFMCRIIVGRAFSIADYSRLQVMICMQNQDDPVIVQLKRIKKYRAILSRTHSFLKRE